MLNIDSYTLRKVLGRFATGVGVVIVDGEGSPDGMTVNSFTSLSLDPPLVLFCSKKDSETAGRISEKRFFSINILTHEQEPISRYFAGDRDTDPEITWGWQGSAPYVIGANASLICRLSDTHPGGDHTILVAEVVDVKTPEDVNEPLIYYCGGYRRLTA